jgi:predicted MFS family arabinose efflux permease
LEKIAVSLTLNILPGKKLAVTAISVMLLILAAAMTVVSIAAFDYADKTLTRETVRKADGVARALASTINEAEVLGIPLDKMPQLASDIERIRAQYVELERISVSVGGVLLVEAKASDAPAQRQDSINMAATMPINLASGEVGLLTVTVDPLFIKRQFAELLLDLLVILVVSGFVTLELIYFLAGPVVVSPLRSLALCVSRLTNIEITGAIPGYFPGALRQLALALRTEQNNVMAEYQAAKRDLRQRLAHYRVARQANEKTSLTAAIHGLRQIRDEYGLSTQTSRAVVIDPLTALGRMRAPFFLLMLAEDLSRSFLPIYAGSMEVGSLMIAPTWVVGLPIFLFMFIVAVSQPILGGWSERVGRRNAFLLGAALAVAAHLLAAQSTSLIGLLAWRGLAGAAWAIAFVAAQGMVLDYTDSSTRTKGLAGFIGVIMVSLACGPAVGGLLADGLGQRETFVVAAGLALLSLIVSWVSLPYDRTKKRAKFNKNVVNAEANNIKKHPLTNLKFVGLLLLAAVPAKLILVAYCYFLLPLYLSASGSNAATAGRIIMIYSVLMVLFVPLGADMLQRLGTKRLANNQAWFVGIGIGLSGVAGLAMLIPNAMIAAAVLVSILGVAQAISISPQAALVPLLARAEIAARGEANVYGYYRLVERIGSAVGPLAAAAMLQWATFRQSFMVLGGIVILCGVSFVLLYTSRGNLDSNDSNE